MNDSKSVALSVGSTHVAVTEKTSMVVSDRMFDNAFLKLSNFLIDFCHYSPNLFHRYHVEAQYQQVVLTIATVAFNKAIGGKTCCITNCNNKICIVCFQKT